MNRLRAAYLEIDPSLAPYFITGVTDDEAGIAQTYTMGPMRNVSHVAASAGDLHHRRSTPSSPPA